MPSIITREQRIYNSKLYKRILDCTGDRFYFAVGKNTDWPSEPSPDTPVDSIKDLQELRDDLLFYKKLSKTTLQTVTRRIDWDSGGTIVYDAFDDSIDMLNKDYYVMTDEFNVYKCIDNNGGVASTTKPTGTSNNIITLADGYRWKYMFTLSGSEVFTYLTDLHIPIKTLSSDDGSSQWDVQQSAIDGGLHRIEITDGGSGYSSAPNVTINSNTGSGATATATLSGDAVDSITITDPGEDYLDVSIVIDDPPSGTTATGRGILSPKGGHGSDALSELGDGGVMFQTFFDEDEEGDFPQTEEYRQLSVILNPVTTTLGTKFVVAGSDQTDFDVSETVEGGTSGATSIVRHWDSENGVLYVDNNNSFTNGETITGDSSGAVRTISSQSPEDLPATEDSYASSEINTLTGDILYMENRVAIERTTENNEEFRFVIQF